MKRLALLISIGLLATTQTWGLALFPDAKKSDGKATPTTTIIPEKKTVHASSAVEVTIPEKSNTGTPAIASTQTEKSMPKFLPPETRCLIFEMEPLISRGDLRVDYEIPSLSEWSILWQAHWNPHPDFRAKTGQLGILGGLRYYVDKHGVGPYFQFLGGFNDEVNNQLALNLQLGGGYAYPIRKNLRLEFGGGVERAYTDLRKDLMIYGVVNVAMMFDGQVLGF